MSRPSLRTNWTRLPQVALPENRMLRLVCELCYAVLVQMVHKHAQNSSHVAAFLEEVQEQLVPPPPPPVLTGHVSPPPPY